MSVALLERALGYALGTVQTVTPRSLTAPTPCQEWDLGALLHHLNESLSTLHEGMHSGTIDPPCPDDDCPDDPAAAFRARAAQLLGACAGGPPDPQIAIAGCPLSVPTVAAVGALELAVHGWDVAQASGNRRPIPAALALDLLEIGPLLVPDGHRHALFAAQVHVPSTAAPSDRLVAFLGRTPGPLRQPA